MYIVQTMYTGGIIVIEKSFDIMHNAFEYVRKLSRDNTEVGETVRIITADGECSLRSIR